jgi:hypothetical protein
MLFRNHPSRASFLGILASLTIFACLTPIQLAAQDDNPQPEKHGRKYKAPPETSRIEVTVLKGFNKKPIDGAHVIFHSVKDGKDEGNLEVKTHPDGKAVIDVIPTGSSVRIQVLADGFATFADDYVVTEPNRQIVVSMIRPRAQVSTYVDNEGKASTVQPGIQEPVRTKKATTTSSTGSSTAPAPPPADTKPQQ